jgi:hypothetical protein
MEMRLQLDSKYGIKRLDPMNIVVYEIVERTKKEDGSKYLDDKVLGYYSDLKQALIGYEKYSIRNCNTTDVDSLLSKLEDIRIAIKGVSELTEGTN